MMEIVLNYNTLRFEEDGSSTLPNHFKQFNLLLPLNFQRIFCENLRDKDAPLPW